MKAIGHVGISMQRASYMCKFAHLQKLHLYHKPTKIVIHFFFLNLHWNKIIIRKKIKSLFSLFSYILFLENSTERLVIVIAFIRKWTARFSYRN